MNIHDKKYEMLQVLDDGGLSGKDAFACEIVDWQFEPFFKKGDFLIFTKQDDIEIGQIGAYLKGDQFFVKQKGEGILRSLDVHTPDILLTKDFQCIGLLYGKALLPKSAKTT